MYIKRFFIYARKSTDDSSRQIQSINDQLAEVKELADKEQLEIADVFIERQTAKSPGRQVFNEMLDRVEQGEANGILAWHPDRLARNAIDGGRIIHLIDTDKIVDLKFPTFRFEPTAQGKFMLSIMFGQSKYYVDNLSENIRRGQRNKVKNGIWPSTAPIGYLNDPITRTIVLDPKNAPLVKELFELYATGDYTLLRLRDTIVALGLKRKAGKIMAISNVQHILKNTFYYGIFKYKEELYEGKHEPIISKALFDKCQEVMKKRGKPQKPRYKQFLYRGKIHCAECGCTITMETQKGHNYLRCTKKKGKCSQPFLREERIAEQIAAQIRRVAIPDEWAEWFFEKTEEIRADEIEASRQRRAELREELVLCDTRLARLRNAFLDGEFDQEEYREVKNEIILQKKQIQESIEVFEKKAISWLEPFKRFITASNQASYIADSGNPDEQWQFFKNVGSNLTLRRGRLLWDARGVWQSVIDKDIMVINKQGKRKNLRGFAAKKHELTIKWSL